RSQYMKDAFAVANELETAFRERARRDELSYEWRCLEGAPEKLVPLEARGHDLLVIGQSHPKAGGAWHTQPLVERTVINSGHPLIVVPYWGSHTTIGERVLIAWNGTQEAAHAVEDAMPILKKSREAIVVTVDVHEGEALSVEHIEQLLERHGVSAQVRGTKSHGMLIGDVLLSEAGNLRCDLLVMGAYGHSPVREHLLGGATDYVLEHMTLPVFMAH
ncbi:MAG: universal stress protein, partial [Planctomycetota bacterium]